MTTITLIRHGQASSNEVDYDRLSELGHRQATHLGEVLHAGAEPVDAVVSGTMRRHLETAHDCMAVLAAGGSAVPVVPQAMPGFDEFDHWQVIARHEPRYAQRQVLVDELVAADNADRLFAGTLRGALARWMGGEQDPDYDEPWPVFQQRCRDALMAVVQAQGDHGHVLVFTSGGVIAALVRHVLALDDAGTVAVNWSLVNAGMTTLVWRDGHLLLLSVNEHRHFRGAHRHLLTWR